MSRTSVLDLSRRERQIMNVIYRLGEATATEVGSEMPDPPSNAAVRSALAGLVEKGLLSHRQDGPRYVYLPTVPTDEARESALGQVVRNFCSGSIEQAVSALLDMESTNLSAEELDRLADMVEEAKRRGK